MTWTDVTDPTSSWTDQQEATATIGIEIGNPIGLLLALTYAEASVSSSWVDATDPTSSWTAGTDNSASWTDVTDQSITWT